MTSNLICWEVVVVIRPSVSLCGWALWTEGEKRHQL